MVRPAGYRLFHVVAMIFVSSLLISNAISVKVITFWGFNVPAGIIVFPIAYMFGDILTEVYGYSNSRTIIWWGFFCLAGMSVLFFVATLIPAASFWNDQEAFARLFGFVPRIAVSSFISYLVGALLNSMVMSRMKVVTQGRHLWLRAIASTAVGQGVDSIIFNLFAFVGIYPLKSIAFITLSGFVLKCVYGAVALPFIYFIVAWLKRAEGVDVYDRDISYNPFRLD